MNIKVFGAGCAKCDKLYANVLEAVRLLGIDAEVEQVSDARSFKEFGIVNLPRLMIDGNLVFPGRVKKTDEIISWIK